MAMNDFKIKIRLDVVSDAEDTCEGCRWGLPKRDYNNGETDPRVLHCKFRCMGCGDTRCRSDREVLRSRTACHYFKPNLRARQVRALEGILAMMTRERMDRAGEALSRDVGASVAEFADAVQRTAEASRRHPGIRTKPKVIDTPCPNCGYHVELPGAGVKVTCDKCGTKLTLHHDDLITVEPPDNP